jgi:hypothetical protein
LRLPQATLPRYSAVSDFGVSSGGAGSDASDWSNLEARPQLKHSAAGLPLAPASSRWAVAPQCGQVNFMLRFSR